MKKLICRTPCQVFNPPEVAGYYHAGQTVEGDAARILAETASYMFDVVEEEGA